MAKRNDFVEGVAFTFCMIVLVFIVLSIIIPAASYELPVDTTCRDAESLRMRNDCNFGRGDLSE
jgi:hypothetical protein